MKKVTMRVISLIMAVSLMFVFSGCGEVKKAETAVAGMFESFKALDFEKAREYVNVDEIRPGSSGAMTGNMEMFMKNLFDKLTYEIVSSEKIDSNTVNVNTKITAIDMKPVFSEFFTAALQYAMASAFANPQPTEAETAKKMEELFVASASKPDLATVTNEVVIKVVKGEDGWKIASDETLSDALLGGITAAINDINNIFSK